MDGGEDVCQNCGGTHEDTMGVCPDVLEPSRMEEPYEGDYGR